MQITTTNRTESRERGAVAVEMALVLPLLVMLVFGIIEFGRGYNAKVELTGAVREGARVLALGGTGGETDSAVTGAAPNLDSISISKTACAGNGTGDATVTATYDLDYGIPFVASGTWTLRATGVMKCEV